MLLTQTVIFMPDGRRVLTCSQNGEFTLWNAASFNFETILQAHNNPVRTATVSHSENWLISADDSGQIKYWQMNFNNLKQTQAHGEPIRGVSFSPTDLKFATCADDATIKIFDFARAKAETTLNGHGGDVRCVSGTTPRAWWRSGGEIACQTLGSASRRAATVLVHATHAQRFGKLFEMDPKRPPLSHRVERRQLKSHRHSHAQNDFLARRSV